jgi:hypothetical protein
VVPRQERPRTEAGASVSTIFDERLTVPWWAWPATLAAAAFLAAELAIGAFYLRHWSTFAVAAAVAGLALLWFGRIRVRVVTGAEPALRVDDATLPVRAMAGLEVLDPRQRRELLGPAADPLGFVIQRPWVPGGVRVDLDDPADPTPYWFISTRRPDALAAALHQAGVPRSPSA